LLIEIVFVLPDNKNNVSMSSASRFVLLGRFQSQAVDDLLEVRSSPERLDSQLKSVMATQQKLSSIHAEQNSLFTELMIDIKPLAEDTKLPLHALPLALDKQTESREKQMEVFMKMYAADYDMSAKRMKECVSDFTEVMKDVKHTLSELTRSQYDEQRKLISQLLAAEANATALARNLQTYQSILANQMLSMQNPMGNPLGPNLTFAAAAMRPPAAQLPPQQMMPQHVAAFGQGFGQNPNFVYNPQPADGYPLATAPPAAVPPPVQMPPPVARPRPTETSPLRQLLTLCRCSTHRLHPSTQSPLAHPVQPQDLTKRPESAQSSSLSFGGLSHTEPPKVVKDLK
jgi:hypothetical protein